MKRFLFRFSTVMLSPVHGANRPGHVKTAHTPTTAHPPGDHIFKGKIVIAGVCYLPWYVYGNQNPRQTYMPLFLLLIAYLGLITVFPHSTWRDRSKTVTRATNYLQIFFPANTFSPCDEWGGGYRIFFFLRIKIDPSI